MHLRRAALWENVRNYATVVYSNLIRQVYKKTPIIIGGIEASLRRMAHMITGQIN